MVGLIMTSGQMGVSSFGRNTLFGSNYACNSFCSYAFWIRRTPIFFIGLNVKKNENNQFLGVKIQNSRTTKALLKGESDNQLVDGGLPEKESEFKPSFNEYLKALELVRVRRDKRQANNSKKQKMNNNPVEKGLFRTPPMEEGEENVKLEKFQAPLNQEKVLQVVEEEGLSKNALGIVGKQNQVRSKLSHNGKGSKEFKDEIDAKEGNVDAKFNKKSGREITRRMFSEHQTNRVEKEPEYTSWERSTKVRDAQGSSRALASVQSKHHNINIELKQVRLRKKGMDISQQDHKSLPKTFEEEKIDIRRDKQLHGGLERKYVRVEEVTTNEFEHSNGKLTASRVDDYDSEVERAAFKTFDEFDDVMDKPRVPRVEMEERIQKLANRLNGADIDMPEWMFSKTMRSAGIRFSDHSILRIIQILGKLGNWRRALQVIEWLQRHERFKSHKLRFIYTTALDVLGKANRPVEALNVFHSMQQHISSYPDLVAYHCIAVSLGKAGYLKELFDVIDSMRSPPKKKLKTRALGEWDPRLEPDIVVYNAVLNACVQQKQWEGAFWVLQQLKQQGQQPSSTTYGLVTEVMFACGKFNLVHDFFRKLKKSCFPNALTYKVLVNTLWQEGKTDEAVLAVQDMEKRGIVGSAALYYDLARCLCSAGRCQEALDQIEKICKFANKPLVVTYTGLIQACLDSGNIQDGAFIFNKMQNFCSPNLVTCNIMLKAYLAHGMFEEAKELFQKMTEDANCIRRNSDYRLRVIPDIYTFNTMLDACVANKRWDDFENIYRRMLHHGYHFNAKRHLRMILEASRAGKRELLETTWIYLAESGRTPPAPLIKERFFMKLENDDYTSALSCITSHPINELQALSKTGWLNLLKENAHRFQKDAVYRLIHKVSILINRHESPNLVLQNLMSACQEFCRTHMTLAEIKQIENVCTE